jgi:hypothetical protein
MNKKGLLIFLVCAVVILAAALYTQNRNAKNTIDIVVTNIDHIDFENTIIDSNIAWVPGEKNSIAAVEEGFSRGDVVSSYNLETGIKKQVYNLKDYGISLGYSIQFFWSDDGRRIITGPASVANLETHIGWRNLELLQKHPWLDVFGISSDGKSLLAETGGILFINADSGKYQEFQIDSKVFSSQLHPLAWSSDGSWIAVRSYDPNYPPTPYPSPIPFPTLSLTPLSYARDEPVEALYLLRADGQEAKLIARNINGTLDHVTFSRNNKRLIWVVADYDGNQSIYIANIDGSDAHEIFSNKGLSVSYKITRNILWSEDGNRLVYLGGCQENVCPFWILTLGTGEPVKLIP